MSADALPDVIVIGAMKCATSAVHAYLDAHPDIAMSRLKELNFFNGPEVAPHDDPQSWWRTGQWHRGLDWYASQFDPDAPVRGESSPAYTAPDSVEAAGRMASVVPGVRLVYLVRDPVERAVSQYAHHRRDGTERRSLREAVLDPGSQYLARSRYHERLAPYLALFDRGQVLVVVQERLLHRRDREIARIYEHAGVDPRWRHERHARRVHVGATEAAPAAADVADVADLRGEVLARVGDDVERLRGVLGDDIPEWSR